jgi:hypothetical protein
MALEAQRIAGLGRGGAVVAPAIGLDDKAEVRPEEVDLELVDELFGQRGRQARRRGDRPEEQFQFVVGEPEGVLVENAAKTPNTGLARVILKRAT